MLQRSVATALAVLLPRALAAQTVNYSGQWAITPSAGYTCAAGIVQVGVNRLQIADNYPSVAVSLLPIFGGGALTGSFTTATSFTATYVSPGSCTLTASLALTFTGPGQFSGTLVIDFSSPGIACLDCARRTWSIQGSRAAEYTTFGAGCAGSLGVTHLTANSLPRLGTSMVVSLDRLPVDVAFLLTGLSNTSSALGPLPLDLAAFGAPGCAGRVSPDATALLVGAGNAASWSLFLPNAPSLLGTRFYQQALVVDPGRNALGGVVSDAAAATAGS